MMLEIILNILEGLLQKNFRRCQESDHLDNVKFQKTIEIFVSSTPPKNAEYLIYLLIPKKNREVMLGDLEEDFYIVCEKFGPLKAKFHYWFQVLRSIPPLIGASALKILMASITKAFRTTN